MTRAEVILWNYIRRKQIKGIKFRRQFSIENFVVDFYAPEIKLTLEVDEATHLTDEELENDRKRQEYLENPGLTFLRFTNPEIYYSIDIVLNKISNKIDELRNN